MTLSANIQPLSRKKNEQMISVSPAGIRGVMVIPFMSCAASAAPSVLLTGSFDKTVQARLSLLYSSCRLRQRRAPGCACFPVLGLPRY